MCVCVIFVARDPRCEACYLGCAIQQQGWLFKCKCLTAGGVTFTCRHINTDTHIPTFVCAHTLKRARTHAHTNFTFALLLLNLYLPGDFHWRFEDLFFERPCKDGRNTVFQTTYNQTGQVKICFKGNINIFKRLRFIFGIYIIYLF